MRAIIKGSEPPSLAWHRSTAHADYDNYADRDVLRQHLVAEQRGLCCYCMSRIQADPDRMKIEHWHCQENYPRERLDYANLLGSCPGGEGQPLKLQHCDTRKRNLELAKNPADPSDLIEVGIHYDGDGTIRADDSRWDRELNEVLNLNASFLKSNRRAVLDGFKGLLVKRGHLKTPTLQRMLQKWNGEDDQTSLEPFCQVVVYWLRKRLRRG